MAKDPAFLFYSSDFLSGVSDLTMEERGQYITLLCTQHQKGYLTEKTIRLLVGSCSVDVLNKFSKDSEGNYFNERLKIESEKRSKFTESRRNNGLKGGRPEKDTKPCVEPKNNLVVKHMDSHMEDVNENRNKDIIDIKIEEEVEILKTDLEIAFDDFLEMRKKAKKAPTARAIQLLKRKLNELADDENIKILILNQSTLNNWQDLYPLKTATSSSTKNQINQTEPTAYGIPLSNWQEGYDKVKGISISSELKNRNNEANR